MLRRTLASPRRHRDGTPPSPPTGPLRTAPLTVAEGTDVLLSADASEPYLLDEIRRGAGDAALEVGVAGPGCVGVTGAHAAFWAAPLVFARQFLPRVQCVPVPSIRRGAELLVAQAIGTLPPDQPWRLHVAAHYGAGVAGQHRCELIQTAVREALRRHHRARLRQWHTGSSPFAPGDSLVQLLLLAPDAGWLAVARAPLPFTWRHVMSPFPKGHLDVAVDKAAPCRAFAKLVEAEQRLGRAIRHGDVCVDLGASPGSWSYVALNRGATVLAIDRAPLRHDLMTHHRLRFVRGDAFTYRPDGTVDWLLCDVVAAPDRTLKLLETWVRERWTRHFVVTLKFRGSEDYAKLDGLKRQLPAWTEEFRLLRLTANKNEVCAMGRTLPNPPPAAPPGPRPGFGTRVSQR